MISTNPQRPLHWTAVLLILSKLVACQELPCADACLCYFHQNAFKADCSSNGLHELPGGLSEEIQILDLSGNNFEEFPRGIEALQSLNRLDLSNNKIRGLRFNSLVQLTQLQILILSYNNFTSWTSLNPNDVFRPAESLINLDLSGNPFNNFGNLRSEEYIVSGSLEVLKLKNCGIQSVHGPSPLAGVNNLKTLILSYNPLRRIQKLVHPSLSQLDLSHCELNYIHHDELLYLPSLNSLNLSNNYRLIISTTVGSLTSSSLMYLDISLCNVDKPGISGFANLREANIRGNMIRRLEALEFSNNSNLEMLDLSSNVIDSIDVKAFQGLTSLTWMNLSVNVIPQIPEETFVKMAHLETLLLSRNYFTSVGNIKSDSIKKLDMSFCEIQYFFSGSLNGKPSLTEINLSRNLIARIPDDIESSTLQILDLSYNRISMINNNTFHRLPMLTKLNVAGNRFSSIWAAEYFTSNIYLQEIYMRDNTWRCDCFDEKMRQFYLFLTNEPPKIWNINTLMCHSPMNYSGMNWEEACYFAWNPDSSAQNDKVLLFMMVMFVGIAACIFIVMLIKRAVRARLKALNEDRERQLEEARERLRLLRAHTEEDAQVNAPDPRDLISPPTYDEALLMPRLQGSYFSLADVDGAPKKKRHRRRRSGQKRYKSSGDIVNAQPEQTDEETNLGVGEISVQSLENSPMPRRRAPSLDTAAATSEFVVEIEPRPSRVRSDSNRESAVPESNV